MKKTVIYVHGKGGNAGEAEHFKPLFPNTKVMGFDYRSETPWEAKTEFLRFFETEREKCDAVILAANSIGAYFSMNALSEREVSEAFFISPVADMERLISDMMSQAGVTERELCEKGEIETELGETLSWKYLCYVRKNPILWNVPTHILYGECDTLIPYGTVKSFAEKIGADLTVAPKGEHWFHTPEQMRFLDGWIEKLVK